MPSKCLCSSTSTRGAEVELRRHGPPTMAAPGNGGEQAGYALDVVVVQHPNGRLCSSDWHVVFRGSSAVAGGITVWLNGAEVPAGPMRAPAAGEPAVFEAETSQAAPSRRLPPDSTLQELLAAGLLRPGRNELAYHLPSGGGRVLAFLYLWSSATPVVVFDIDGTVTQADVVGHVGQAIGHSFLHAGICEFACRVHSQGYAVLFLSARPLSGPTGIEPTRRFLFHVSRDPSSGFGLPLGPVITTPHTSTVSALLDELTHKSGIFKKDALRRIAALYAPDGEPVRASADGAAAASAGDGGGACGPCRAGTGGATDAGFGATPRIGEPAAAAGLFAGFGNRSKDATAYHAAGIDPSRIFIINDRSSIVRWSARPSVAVNVNGGKVNGVNVNGGNVNGVNANYGGGGPTAAPVAVCGAAARQWPHSDNTAGGGQAAPVCQWASYIGMMDSVSAEFPLRWPPARAQQAVQAYEAAAADRLRVASSSGAPRCGPWSCFRGMRL